MMNFDEGLRAVRSICEDTNGKHCSECDVYKDCIFTESPMRWDDERIDRTVRAAEEHMKRINGKTLLDVLLERLPDVNIVYGTPTQCPHKFFGKELTKTCEDRCDEECTKCWNQLAPQELLRRLGVKG